MFSIWWPALIVPGLMELCGAAGCKIPWNHYGSRIGGLDAERQAFADKMLHDLLRQIGVVYAVLALMVMCAVKLLAENIQLWLVFATIVVEIVGVLLLALPIRGALDAQFGAQDDEGDGQ